MTNQKVERKQTPVNETEMTKAVIQAFTDMVGKAPTKDQVALLIAQNNLETGSRKDMYNWNVGNITHVDGDGFDYWEGKDWHYIKAPGSLKEQKQYYVAKFRAYPDLKSGVKDYLSFLKRRTGVRNKILEADPIGFSKELKKSKYYTAHEEDYTRGIVSKVKEYNKNNSYEQALSMPTENQGDVLAKINEFLDSLAHTNHESKFEKKAAISKLIPNYFLIKIKADSPDIGFEFGRNLSSILEEELLANSSTFFYNDKNKEIEMESIIHGPRKLATGALLQLSNLLSLHFEKSTSKFGAFKVYASIYSNKKSNIKEQLTINMIEKYYQEFHNRISNGK